MRLKLRKLIRRDAWRARYERRGWPAKALVPPYLYQAFAAGGASVWVALNAHGNVFMVFLSGLGGAATLLLVMLDLDSLRQHARKGLETL